MTEKLLDVMETAPWRFWRFWSKRSKYIPQVLEEDVEKILQSYRNEGFLDAKIEQSKFIISPSGSNRIDLKIPISEGTRSYFGTQKVIGQAIVDSEILLEDSLIKTGKPYSPALLAKERSRLRRIYGDKGYLDSQIRSAKKIKSHQEPN